MAAPGSYVEGQRWLKKLLLVLVQRMLPPQPLCGVYRRRQPPQEEDGAGAKLAQLAG